MAFYQQQCPLSSVLAQPGLQRCPGGAARRIRPVQRQTSDPAQSVSVTHTTIPTQHIFKTLFSGKVKSLATESICVTLIDYIPAILCESHITKTSWRNVFICDTESHSMCRYFSKIDCMILLYNDYCYCHLS